MLIRPYLLLSDSAKEEFASLPSGSSGRDGEAYDSVILGLHEPSLSYGPLNKAFRILKGEPIEHSSTSNSTTSGKCPPVLIAPHASMFHQAAETEDLPAGLSIGIGPFVKALEAASGVEAELVGKPTKQFFELALQRLKETYGQEIRSEDVAVVGDDIENDLGAGAMTLGLKRILGEIFAVENGTDVSAYNEQFGRESTAQKLNTIASRQNRRTTTLLLL